MDSVLHLLQHRRSNKKFGDIAPNTAQLEQMFKAALRVSDHGRLQPYRFFVLEKSAMPTLQQCLESAVIEFDLGKRGAEKAISLTHQAPMVIGIVAHLDHESEKVPAWEQMITAGCATYALQLAAQAQGFDSKWISKKWVESTMLRQLFQCRDGDKIIGLLMVGSPDEGEISQTKESEKTDGFVTFIR